MAKGKLTQELQNSLNEFARRTTVTCPKCGFEIPIEDTERE